MANEVVIYNLVFPEYVNTLNIGGYKIARLQDYKEKYSRLMWNVVSGGGEFPTKIQTGEHQKTAYTIELNLPPILPWSKQDTPTRLGDICLLLSLFTGRDVFYLDKEIAEDNPALDGEYRIRKYGGILRASIPNEAEFFDEKTQLPLSKEQKQRDPYYFLHMRNTGFEKTINKVIDLISSETWRDKYGEGYFLFLFSEAMNILAIESNFLLCWIVWEHLYAVLNKSKYTEKQLENDITAETKIKYLLNHTLGITPNSKSNGEVQRIVKARDRLVHYGKKPDNVDYAEMDLFIRTTEYLICKILELAPSDIFDTSNHLLEFLKIKK